MSLFGNAGSTNNNTAARPGGLFTNLNTSTTGSGLFGASQNKPAETKPFSFSATQNQPQPQGSSIFGNTQQQQQQQTKPGNFSFQFGLTQEQNDKLNAAQRDLSQTLRFGTSHQQQVHAATTLWEEGRGMGVYRSIENQVQIVKDKWDPASLTSPLRTYLYAHVQDEQTALQFRPDPNEDENRWEEAVAKRPGPQWVPQLIRGFGQMANRVKAQAEEIGKGYQLLHEVNASLDAQLERHNTVMSAKLVECKRRQAAASRRVLALAVKVQILRNKGYVMDNAEEELKSKLEKLERAACDPGLDARDQEIWARMLGIRERAKRLKAEMDKIAPAALAEEPVLDEESIQQAKEVCDNSCILIILTNDDQILQGYDTQLRHLHKELQLVQSEYEDWQKFSEGRDAAYRRR
jgi:nuclear pore complex protein Nup54